MDAEQLLNELRRVLSYDPASGIFRWLIIRNCRGGSTKVGSKAGTPKDGYQQIIYTDSEGIRHQFRGARLAWWFVTGDLPKEVDHIDRNRGNDAWANLREVTRTQNNLNAGGRSDNKSGKRGVSWDAQAKKWLARVTIKGRVIHLGYFTDLEAACEARRAGEMEYLGKLCPA